MTCNCENESTIKITAGKTANLHFTFSSDVSTYPQARFIVRKNYDAPVLLNKVIDKENLKDLDIELTPDDTAIFNDFLPNKEYGQYIWGLDLLDTENNVIINVFPMTGTHAPMFLVFKNVTEE